MFRPCIDLHEGKVKQIVGGTLADEPGQLRTNFVSERPSGIADRRRHRFLKSRHHQYRDVAEQFWRFSVKLSRRE